MTTSIFLGFLYSSQLGSHLCSIYGENFALGHHCPPTIPPPQTRRRPLPPLERSRSVDANLQCDPSLADVTLPTLVRWGTFDAHALGRVFVLFTVVKLPVGEQESLVGIATTYPKESRQPAPRRVSMRCDDESSIPSVHDVS
jgi:hypothetical protein